MAFAPRRRLPPRSNGGRRVAPPGTLPAPQRRAGWPSSHGRPSSPLAERAGGGARAAGGGGRPPPPLLLVVQPGLPPARGDQLAHLRRDPRTTDPLRGCPPDSRLGRPATPAGGGPPLLCRLPARPDEPLIFLEFALPRGLAAAIGPLIDPRRAVASPSAADTATFYSINNCQRGLRGISFGNFLIKQVVDGRSTVRHSP